MGTGHHKGLTMRTIKVEEVDQFSDIIKYVFQVSKKTIDEDVDLIAKKSHQLKPGTALGWFDKDKLISQIVTLPFEVNIHGVIYKMGGVTGVGTYPEYAGQGLIHMLMKESLKRMREKGQYISYLYPYSIPYYRKNGWEIISDLIEYKIKDTQLPKYREINGRVRRVDMNHHDVKKVYDAFARKTNGAMVRNDLAWEAKLLEGPSDIQSAVYYTEDDKPEGYLNYRVLEEKFYVDEMIYLNEEARRGLWNFINAHFSMVYFVEGKTCVHEPVAFLLEDGEIEQKIFPYFMGRIVEVKGFLERFPFKEVKNSKIILKLNDPILEWNRGTFILEWDEKGKLQIDCDKNIRSSEGITLSIQTLATMLLSYQRPSFLMSISRISGDKQMVDMLEKIIPNNAPCFFDYF
ncbi:MULTISPECIES: GNAT family N-acetyltransferase [Bacillus]|uniref:GNAT family N-acetyltransferase n=1 Tax=Bacillus TaxID=1386 RepID=UPI0002DACDFB|nr:MULTISPECIES: GNAT family N-acetyltransferase [Bacillus]